MTVPLLASPSTSHISAMVMFPFPCLSFWVQPPSSPAVSFVSGPDTAPGRPGITVGRSRRIAERALRRGRQRFGPGGYTPSAKGRCPAECSADTAQRDSGTPPGIGQRSAAAGLCLAAGSRAAGRGRCGRPGSGSTWDSGPKGSSAATARRFAPRGRPGCWRCRGPQGSAAGRRPRGTAVRWRRTARRYAAESPRFSGGTGPAI